MPSKSITDAFVRNVKLPRKDERPNQLSYFDTLERGLALVLTVSYGGTRTFNVMTYVDGKPRTRKLGTYPRMTVKAARAGAREYWADPRRFDAQAAVGTFKEIAENWKARHVNANRLRSEAEIVRILSKYVYPRWKDRKFLDLRRGEVNDLLDRVADAHGLSQADAVLAVIRGIMTWYQSRDENYTCPIVRGMKRNKNAKARERILADDEIRAVWKVCDEMGPFGSLTKLLLLTAQRREKVASMRWEDIKDGTWTIPSSEREKGTAGKIKLPEAALNIIESQLAVVGNPFVFAGSERGQRRKATDKASHAPAFNSFSEKKAELDKRLPGMTPWVMHDLRRTARSLMARADVRPDIAERVLGHAIKGVEGVYDRHQYEVQKADALNRLARLIETITAPPADNVIALTR